MKRKGGKKRKKKREEILAYPARVPILSVVGSSKAS